MAFWRGVALLSVVCAALGAESGFYLKNGDRVVFYGDSITDQRLYTTFVETYAVTRFPKEHFTFIHSGWGGDRVSGGGGGPISLRLERDVIAYKPTVMTIMLGMNDAGYKPFDQSVFDIYASGYQRIIETVRSSAPDLRITAIQPSPYDDATQTPKFEGGYNAVLLRYSQFVKELAARDKIDTADLNTPVVADLKRAFAANPEGAKKLIPDRVHPGPAGHLLMAEELLRAWHAPSVVSTVELDASARKVTKSENALVTAFNGTTWTETDQALPMPIDWSDASTKLAVESSDFLDALDRELLQVNGLNAGKWDLRIDGEIVGAFDREELARGVNLARFDTPMMRQADTVHSYTLRRADVHNTRWRNIQVPLAKIEAPEKDNVMQSLDRLDLQLAQAQHKAAQPVSHKFELVPKS